ncbi:MAG TPA: 2Fe-2S iron-sulfur cluster-binding protein, partial [Ramlibacter sp.]|nr:2Fe-2S iron-sulfur cluster-binding protein [Ramlibacter sp.]
MTNSAHEGPRARVRLEPDGRSFACAPGQTLLAAALAAGIDLPYECASGSCGTCRGQLIAGGVESR